MKRKDFQGLIFQTGILCIAMFLLALKEISLGEFLILIVLGWIINLIEILVKEMRKWTS